MIDRLFEIMSKAGPHSAPFRDRAWDQLVEVVRGWGYDVVLDNDVETWPFGWNGKTIRIENTPRAVFDLAHEIGHLQCSNPIRRSTPEFGLGAGFSTMSIDWLEPMVSEKALLWEEQLACIMAAMWLDHVGLDNICESHHVGYIDTNTRNEVHWVNNPEADLAKQIVQLIEFGLIPPDLSSPKPVLRSETQDHYSED